MPLTVLLLQTAKDTHNPINHESNGSISAPPRMSRYSHGRWKLNHVLFDIAHDFTTVTLLTLEITVRFPRVFPRRLQGLPFQLPLWHTRFMLRGSILDDSCCLPLQMHLLLLWTSASKWTTFVPAQHLERGGFTTWKAGRFWLLFRAKRKKSGNNHACSDGKYSNFTTQPLYF